MSLDNNLYEKDFYKWCLDQADILKSHDYKKLDFTNLIEEIECMGRRERQELVNRLAVLFCHILKWRNQPSLRCKSWIYTIEEQRDMINEIIEENPSLKHSLQECSEKAYKHALRMAAKETGMKMEQFPSCIQFDLDSAMKCELDDIG